MRTSLVNLATADDYADALTLRLPRAVRVVVQVANAAVIYQLDDSDEGKGLWTNEAFLGPSFASFDRRCSGIRFRSAAAGAPAQLSCELLDAAAVAEGADAVSAATYSVGSSGSVAPSSGGDGALTGDYKFAVQAADHGDWLLCDGRAVSRTTYAALFAVVGTAFGVGDGATTFNLPDCQGRTLFAVGTHVDVNQVGDSDGLALAARTAKGVYTTGDPPGAGGGTFYIRSAGFTPTPYVVAGRVFIHT